MGWKAVGLAQQKSAFHHDVKYTKLGSSVFPWQHDKHACFFTYFVFWHLSKLSSSPAVVFLCSESHTCGGEVSRSEAEKGRMGCRGGTAGLSVRFETWTSKTSTLWLHNADEFYQNTERLPTACLFPDAVCWAVHVADCGILIIK